MIQLREGNRESRDFSSSMDNIPTYMQASNLVPANGRRSLDSDSSFYFNGKSNPFADSFPDPLCRLNLKETSDFVKALPVTPRGILETSSQRRREGLRLMGHKSLETPSTPGRPLFSFSPVHFHRKNIPSKWDDAEKWLFSSTCRESPARVTKPTDSTKLSRKNVTCAEKVSTAGRKAPSSVIQTPHGTAMHMNTEMAFHGASSEVFLIDKTTNNMEIHPNPMYPKPSYEGFFSKSLTFDAKKDTEIAGTLGIQQRDTGTEMTPLGSSVTTRCHTPIRSSSPARHNTPAERSGLLISSNTCISVSELTDFHFTKLNVSTQYDSTVSNWNSREEAEAEAEESKSLTHLDVSNVKNSVGMSWASAWEEDERTKSCLRFQREEAKIQALLNLQYAKAEAESRKLEVKIQKMRSNLEEKLMRRMAVVHRKAEEWRVVAQQQHSEQLKRASENARKIKNKNSSQFNFNSPCGCFSCKKIPLAQTKQVSRFPCKKTPLAQTKQMSFLYCS